MKKRFEIKNWISVIVLAALFVVLGTMSGGKLITPLNIKNLLEQSLPIIIGGAGVIYIIAMEVQIFPLVVQQRYQQPQRVWWQAALGLSGFSRYRLRSDLELGC